MLTIRGNSGRSRGIAVLFAIVLVAALLATVGVDTASADVDVISATVNGGTAVTVAPEAPITATVTVRTTGGHVWAATSWTIHTVPGSGGHCTDTPNHGGNNANGTYAETFTITAPYGAGTYYANFSAWQNDGCTMGIGTTLYLLNAVTVSAITKLAFSTGAVDGDWGECLGPITVQTRNASDVPTGVASDTTISLATEGPGAFYTTDACTTATTSVTVPAGANSASVYYKASGLGDGLHTVTATAGGLTQAQQDEIIGDPPTASLTVIKHVINHGGSAVAGDWHMDISDASSPSSDLFDGVESPGTTITINPGAFSVGETGGPAGYTIVDTSGTCSGTAVGGGSYTCTITNEETRPQLTVVKQVVNHGGSAVPGDWQIDITAGNPYPRHFDGNSGGTLVYIDSGAFSVGESGGPPFYSMSTTGSCSGTAVAGGTYTCTIVNEQETGRIIVKKLVSPGAPAATFTFHPSWGADFSLAGGESLDSGVIPAGLHSLSEAAPAGWSLLSAVCSDGSSPTAIGLSGGETVTCTFTNAWPICFGRPATIVGTPGDDTIRGTPGDDVIVGLGGDDVIRGLGGNDRICNGPGADTVYGGGGRDRIRGGAGADILFGGLGDDWLRGGIGLDEAHGGLGVDQCWAETTTACE